LGGADFGGGEADAGPAGRGDADDAGGGAGGLDLGVEEVFDG